MPIIQYNLDWMTFNIILAVIPVVLGLLITQIKHTVLRSLLLVVWLLFIPNTIYLLTDLIHLPPDLRYTEGYHQLIIIAMYQTLVVIGILTYILGIYTVHKILFRHSTNKYAVLMLLNSLISIGLILGRVYRYNSWDIMIKPLSIIMTSLQIITSPEYIIFIVVFSITGTLVYKYLTQRFKKVLVKFA